MERETMTKTENTTAQRFGIPNEALEMVCEVCGQPAVCMVRDMREKRPDKAWREFEPDGPPHLFCERHQRDSHFTEWDYDAAMGIPWTR